MDKKRSDIWKHFCAVNSHTAKCNLCNILFSYKSGSTGNLKRHLQRKHPLCLEQRLEQTSSSTEMAQTSTQNANNNTDTDDIATTQSHQQTTKQTTLTCYIKRPLPLKTTKQIDEQLVKMLVSEYQPLSLVDNVEFKSFCKLLNSNYELPSRKIISNSLLPQLYNSLEEMVKTKLKDAENIAITTDGWTSINNESYQAITVHFIDSNCKLVSLLIGCRRFNESHTAQNLESEIKKILLEWKINNKIVAMVTDNAANITAAVRLLQYQHIPCFAHTLNIIVQKSLSHINIVHKKLKAVVQFFKHSPQATLKLINLQTQLGNQKTLKLKQDVATRWNSTLEMFERIITIKEALQSALAITNCNIRLTEEDLTIINWTCKVLKPFKIISEELSSEKAVTISKVVLFRKMLLDYIKNIDNQSTTIMPTEIINLCKFITNQLEKRLNYIKNDFIYADATFIDPRFKKAGFMNEHKTDKEDALFESSRQRIIQKVEAMIKENQPEVEYNLDQPMEENDDVIWHVFDSTVSIFNCYIKLRT